ncbi:putative universal stress protein SAUSA300_1656 [Octopus bimaculoides]|uniref:putative universal stress protein SAUSA300_1656 n=1 Tax=Octopus bimaculoides TaxID=37653 RepID=UPI00071E65BB|nr:putative universal stress protein SAUSA300_1656 [Octopus bimaculoides]|eukprot:XP_014775911.1 PREDICTED: putative universal stress protein SAS1637 [Octopus bimaculoides]
MSSSEGRTVVIGMDGSEYSEYAFNWYMEQVYRQNDHIILVYCPEFQSITHSPYVMADVTILVDMMKEEEKQVKAQLEKFGEMLKNAGVGGKVKSINGRPGEVIVNVAKEDNASLIVTGTRGMGTIRRTLVGSISDYVIHHSPVPVLVCRSKDHHGKEHHGKEHH